MQGKAVIVSAPSGAGKTTIVKHVLIAIPRLEFSISACSRVKRDGETHGKDYYFISADDFKNKIGHDEFVEWQEVYPGSFYGTLKSEMDRIWSQGKVPIFDVDVVGGLNLKRFFGSSALAIFIQPPSVEILHQRLRNRGTETDESLQKRISKAEHELSFATSFDTIVINNELQVSTAKTILLIEGFLSANKPQ